MVLNALLGRRQRGALRLILTKRYHAYLGCRQGMCIAIRAVCESTSYFFRRPCGRCVLYDGPIPVLFICPPDQRMVELVTWIYLDTTLLQTTVSRITFYVPKNIQSSAHPSCRSNWVLIVHARWLRVSFPDHDGRIEVLTRSVLLLQSYAGLPSTALSCV
ncbi:hypothetical protein PHLGIDRAFT_385399 [Phlebiopsis gigantea 11061_1 CR5-6]|uniref:Uncharacterized protein n=1 Tax=Phlebiopsis gigantea (strain 11061_1 CR5-6) TaxID=745531 RepID=A0A0C3S0B9_PHLG1|nr:hypothetical protein PHLGIDRAFT_385399 [Phlebiopsis gigantea 11061_1 CR5-6]